MTDPLPSPAPPARADWAEFTREYLEIVRGERSKKTARRAERQLGLVGAVGPAWTDEFRRVHLTRWYETQKHLSGSTLRAYHSALRTAFEFAVASGYIERNPCLVFPMRFPTVKKAKKRAPTADETDALFALLKQERSRGWIEHRLYALATTVFGAALRPMEGQRLKWIDVDLERGRIDLSREKRKTDAAQVPAAMPDFVVEALEEWYPVCGSEWVFPHTLLTGPWVHGSTGQRPAERLRQASERAGVDPVTLAMLRHAWTTIGAARWGLTEKQIQMQLRHTTARTQIHYTHSDADLMRSVIRFLPFPGVEKETRNHGEKRAESAREIGAGRARAFEAVERHHRDA